MRSTDPTKLSDIADQLAKHQAQQLDDAKNGKPPLRFIDYLTTLPRADEVSETTRESFKTALAAFKAKVEATDTEIPYAPLKTPVNGFKPGEIVLFCSGPGHPSSDRSLAKLLKARASNPSSLELVFVDQPFSLGLHCQSICRLNRIRPMHESRNRREGRYLGRRKGKAYRSRITIYGYPLVGWQQVEAEIWRRADIKEDHDTQREKETVPQS